MKENPYDGAQFFEKYSQMARSTLGLQGAGEWHELARVLPDFTGKKVLDLGCGYGWHCRYAIESGASEVVGVDLSEKMLARARELTDSPRVFYRCQAIEDVAYPEGSFDAVVSSLALHYVEDYAGVCLNVYRMLAPGGEFVLSVEHPVFTAEGKQDWIYDGNGAKAHWPVDRYFEEGERTATFLGETIRKYHRTLTGYAEGLLKAGFQLTALVEPRPDPRMLDAVEGMREELRRPMMLILAAKKA